MKRIRSQEDDRTNITVTLRKNGHPYRTLGKVGSNRVKTNNNEQPEKVHTIVIPYFRGLSKNLRTIGYKVGTTIKSYNEI